ncbi:AAA family ATPase [Desulfurivibrio sp. D14AmB]|uniref:AAA family ATPase n=1 Tax=Desulfurivibrio sp. D14AmB TaxID=3374370 RepID=UPI00376ED255
MPTRSNSPRIYLFWGLIATGKSTLATAWARHLGIPHYNSDVVRKELAGLAPTTDCKEGAEGGIYTPEFTRRTYDALLDRAEEQLNRGRSVVLDASYLDRDERRRVLALAQRLGVACHFILCDCSDQVKKERLNLRARDPRAVSDGRWEIYLRQREKFQPPSELAPGQLLTIDTHRPLAELLTELERQLPFPS